MICEMCGAESQAIEPRKISGSVLQLCSKCASLGKEPTYRESIGHRAFVAQTLEKRQQKAKAAMNIDKSAEGQKSAAVENEEARQSKALINLKTNLASRVQRSANPRWWHKWL